MHKLLRSLVFVLGAIGVFASPAFAEPIAAGAFTNQAQRISGDWSIEHAADGDYLVLSEDFRTRSAPDLKFFLHTRPASQVTARNAAQGVFIGELPRARGAQRIRLPEGVDVSDFRSLVLHCEQYSVLWGAGDLR